MLSLYATSRDHQNVALLAKETNTSMEWAQSFDPLFSTLPKLKLRIQENHVFMKTNTITKILH